MKLKSIPLSGVSPAYTHQTETTTFILKTPRCLITSDPGTGKTRSVLDALVARKKSDVASATLVIAPLSILEAAWGDDIKKFQPDIKYGVAYASNRAKIFSDDSFDVVVTNFGSAGYEYPALGIPAITSSESTLFFPDLSNLFSNCFSKSSNDI